MDVRRHHTDQRSESLRPNLDTLKVIGTIGTADGWRQRLEYVRPLIKPSLCAIKRAQEQHGTSLGIFRPATVDSFRLVPTEPWTAEQQAVAAQIDLLDQDRRPLERIPYEFRYHFRCAEPDCNSHDMQLRDWEAGQSYRNFRRRYGQAQIEAKLRQRWWDEMFTPNRAVHFFVGNLAAYPRTFMLLGLFYPSLAALNASDQGTLF